ncbi:MAG: hypothetical protein IIA49_06070 [Bacteroidetes bacterium]|nr:hypothetical protein [Bacteroidota bacterium]
MIGEGKNWARITQIILAGIAIIYAIWLLIQLKFFSGIFQIIVNGLIGGYLLLSSRVKEAFS